MRDHEGTLQIEYYNISMKTKLKLTRFGGTFPTLRFDRKSFFNTLLGFTTYNGVILPLLHFLLIAQVVTLLKKLQIYVQKTKPH